MRGQGEIDLLLPLDIFMCSSFHVNGLLRLKTWYEGFWIPFSKILASIGTKIIISKGHQAPCLQSAFLEKPIFSKIKYWLLN